MKLDLFDWCKLINAGSKEEYQLLADKNEYIKEAVSEVEIINRDRALREEYLKRKMALMDEESQRESYFENGLQQGKAEGLKQGLEQGKEQGKAEGLEQGKVEAAINAIKLGLTNKQIHAITGISEEKLNQLQAIK